MNTNIGIGALIAALVASAGLTGLVRSYALKKKVMDVANERSMHSVPTPRGGGAAIAIVYLLSVLGLFLGGILPSSQAIGLGLGGLLIAGTGWLDDRMDLPFRVRLLIQAGSAALAVWALGGLTEMNLGFATLSLGWFGNLFAVITVVWLINLFNFMDGIDGMSGQEAVLVGGAMGFVLFKSEVFGAAWAAWLLAAAAAGFLFWNWPPAKIFMGDVGSTLNGYSFGVLALIGLKSGVGMFVWLLIMGAFFCDATVTLICRILNKENPSQAHRTHAFQVAATQAKKHLPVTVAYIFVNVAFLFPLAYLAWTRTEYAGYAGAVGLGVLAILVFRTRGGIKGPIPAK